VPPLEFLGRLTQNKGTKTVAPKEIRELLLGKRIPPQVPIILLSIKHHCIVWFIKDHLFWCSKQKPFGC
jgi:hypothetical protein